MRGHEGDCDKPIERAIERRSLILGGMGSIDLLESEGQKEIAGRILEAAHTVLVEKKFLTHDLGGEATTTQVADAIIAALK